MTAAVDPGEDLFERFGLTSLAAEYARVLPNGEKNALRKTYKGHIKKLGVSGHFDSVKEECNRPDGLMALLKYPQEEWYVQQVRNREVENGFSRDTLSKLDKAMAMGKGIVPKTLWDFSVLGDLGPGKFDKPRDASARPTAPNTPMATAASLPRPKQQQSLAQEAIRPKRSVKKRSYGDSSYEGYGEGFPDDDAQGSGYAPGDGDLGSAGQKRRKKVHSPELPGVSVLGHWLTRGRTLLGSSTPRPGSPATVLAWWAHRKHDRNRIRAPALRSHQMGGSFRRVSVLDSMFVLRHALRQDDT